MLFSSALEALCLYGWWRTFARNVPFLWELCALELILCYIYHYHQKCTSVTSWILLCLTVAGLLEPDGLVSIFQTLTFSWDFLTHTQPPEVMHNGAMNKNVPRPEASCWRERSEKNGRLVWADGDATIYNCGAQNSISKHATQQIEPWGGRAMTAEEYFRFHACRPRTGAALPFPICCGIGLVRHFIHEETKCMRKWATD